MPTPIDVRDMRIVHETFRRAYDESARLVRAAPRASAARVSFLADHIDFGLSMLHHHHESEDLLLYPLLMERVPEHAVLTAEVEAEHRQVSDALASVSAACADWRVRPGSDTGEALGSALEALNEVLAPHLDHEEHTIVPLAAVTLTQQEWDAMGEHSRAAIPRDRMPLAFGMLLEPLGAEDRAHMMAQLPTPVRLLYPVLIGRPWRRYAQRLRNGT